MIWEHNHRAREKYILAHYDIPETGAAIQVYSYGRRVHCALFVDHKLKAETWGHLSRASLDIQIETHRARYPGAAVLGYDEAWIERLLSELPEFLHETWRAHAGVAVGICGQCGHPMLRTGEVLHCTGADCPGLYCDDIDTFKGYEGIFT